MKFGLSGPHALSRTIKLALFMPFTFMLSSGGFLLGSFFSVVTRGPPTGTLINDYLTL